MTPSVSSLYFALPVWAQNALLSAYGATLHIRRYGGVHREVLASLLESQFWSAAELETLQLTRLRELVAHASTVPYYRKLGLHGLRIDRLEQLRQLPTTSKSELRAHPLEMRSEAFRSTELLQIHTGGTTGTPLTVYCHRAALQRNYAFFSRLRAWAKVPARARVATFAGRTIVAADQATAPYWRRHAFANTMLFSSYHIGLTTVPQYVEELARWKPQLIDSYPSSLEPIARFVVEQQVTGIRPIAVITSSETLSGQVRALISSAFQAPVFDHYGSAEMAAFVSQCEHGTYHVNPEFGIVELLQNDRSVGAGEVGEIVATGFINPVMPLIRYRTGDLAVWGDADCACGRRFPVIEQIVGRLDDVVLTPDGRRIGRLDPIFKAVSSFYEARIVQDAVDHVRVEYVAESDLGDDERAKLVRELRNRLGSGMRIDVRRVSSIPRTARGKLRTVVSELGG